MTNIPQQHLSTPKINNIIESRFCISDRKSSIQTEIVAGISTYLSLAYIFIVNPAILSNAGIDPSAVLFATVVASALATIAMGLWANLPFAVAPGLEMNGFFAFVVCGATAMNLNWQQGLGIVFISGLLCIFFTASRIRYLIIASIPIGLKKAVGASVGIFVATIGLFLAKIVAFEKGAIDLNSLSFQSLNTHLSYILYIGLIISAFLSWEKLRFPGGMLFAIIAGAVLCNLWDIKSDKPPTLSTSMFQAIGQFDLTVAFDPKLWSPIIVFFIIDFIGGIGKFIGLTASTNIQDKDGNVPNIRRGLFVDGVATCAGASLGTSSLICFVESAVGIKVGGRTGLTAVTCGILMFASIFFTPILTWVPPQAAAGVLLFVGYLLIPSRVDDNGRRALDNIDMVIAAVMAIITFLTFSLDKSMAFGFLAYFVRSIIDSKGKKPEYWLLAISSVLIATIVFEYLKEAH